MKNYFIVLFLFVSIFLFAQNKTATKIYIVRHAEKITDNPQEKDPELTDKGKERALNLAQFFKKIEIQAVYSTPYKRTQATAQPTASEHGLTIQSYNAKNITTAASIFLEENRGKTILVVGHSNTVLETIEAMGGKKPFDTIADQDYNNLFLVTINTDGTTKVKAMQYGASNNPKKR